MANRGAGRGAIDMQQESASPAGNAPIDPAAVSFEARKVVRRLTQNGFDAYLVGGCVRDLLLRKEPKDFDVATSARPRQIKRLFRNSRIIGRRFRLVHVRFGRHVVEVSTFRAPPEAQGGDDPYIRRDNVFGTEVQDAFRRDFTINGLFYDLRKERVIDHVDALDDLSAKRLRLIGDAELRIREDPVRILRAARFAARLGFEMTPELREASLGHARDLAKAAPPRVLEELYRLLSSVGAADAFRILEELGATEVLLPEISPLPDYFFRALQELERIGGGDRAAVPQSLMVAVLLAPLVKPVLAEEGRHDYEGEINELMRPVGVRLTVARRDLTHARQSLAAQVRLLTTPHGRGSGRFARREFFSEALQLRRMLGPMREVDPDPLPLWAELERPLETGSEPRSRPRRRRRRRRGGRGGRRQA